MDLNEMPAVYDERKGKQPEGEVVPPLPLPLKCCGNCEFSKQTPLAFFCRKYAPRPVTGAKTPIAAWPIVEPADWCGEFKVRG